MISARLGGRQKNNMRYITIIAFLLSANLLYAQGQRFTTTGVIEYEKRVNMFSIIQKSINKDNEAYMAPAFESYKRKASQFRTLKSKMSFGQGKTLYAPVVEETPPSNNFSVPAANQPNTVYIDLDTKTSIIQKEVFEEKFLVKDSIRKINWKLTNETRDIAGYPCRRANALVLDSVYVVAFYTDKIPLSGGPETFTGLPGMILGVALPHENITWFATKVTDMPLPEAITPPKKGKPVDNKLLILTLQKALKSWGEYAKEYYKAFSL